MLVPKDIKACGGPPGRETGQPRNLESVELFDVSGASTCRRAEKRGLRFHLSQVVDVDLLEVNAVHQQLVEQLRQT